MPRTRIDIDRPLHEKADAAIEALAIANDPQWPRVMVRGNELVRATGHDLEGFNKDSLADEISSAAQFERETKDGPKPKDPPTNVVNAVLSRSGDAYEEIPRIERVTDVPVLDPDGRLITEPGCHPTAGIFYAPADGLEGVKPREIETTDDIDWALSLLLDDLLVDFQFDDDASRAHALAMLLQPFVREYIAGPTPMFGIFAPGPGTGKTYLAQACLLPSCGHVPATPGAGGDDAEWRKRITAAMLSGTNAIVFDNLHGSLASSALAGALTSGVWSDRILGESRVAKLPVRNLWVATANNPQMSDEQARRVVPIFLDPGDVRPSERDSHSFKHDDLIGWAEENRPRLVSAALTIISHWLDGPIDVEGGYVVHRTGGPPRESDQTLGSYTDWARVMGGILKSVDVEGFLENRDRLNAEANDERRDAEDFLAAWHELDIGPILSSDLFRDYCNWGQPLHNCLPVIVAEAQTDKRKSKLDYWLRGKHRNLIGPYKLLHEEDNRHKRRWYVTKRDDG